MKILLMSFLFAAAIAPAHAQKTFSANGVALGASESDVKKGFPVAHCKALEWKTDAAERRCDDAKIAIHGIEARITFYLKANGVVAFDVRFDSKDLDKFVGGLQREFGPPKSERKDVIARKGRSDREVTKVLWETGRDRAILTALKDRKRAQLEVSRGSFPEEVYRVR
jgi:hypothetical protein